MRGPSLRLGPGSGLRLNPLDRPPGCLDDREAARRQAELLCSLAAASLDRPLLPAERTAAELAVSWVQQHRPVPTLPDVVEALLAPDRSSAELVRTDVAGLAGDGRDVALDLRRMVEGDLAGMFDGPTSPGIDLGGPLVVLDFRPFTHRPLWDC